MAGKKGEKNRGKGVKGEMEGIKRKPVWLVNLITESSRESTESLVKRQSEKHRV